MGQLPLGHAFLLSLPRLGISPAWQGGAFIVGMETSQIQLRDEQVNSDISVWQLCANKIKFKERCLPKRIVVLNI